MEAIKITNRLLDYINNHNGLTGQIHSVFDGAFNIIDTKGQLIGVLSNDKDLSPFGMVVNSQSLNHKSIVQGQFCEFKDGVVHLQNSKLKIITPAPEVIDLSINDIKQNKVGILPDKLSQLKSLIIEEGSLLGISGLIRHIGIEETVFYRNTTDVELNEYSDFIKERLVELLNTVLNEDYDLFKNTIQKTVGFGPGLTPSTDDFLTGMIVMMDSVDEKLINEINDLCAGKTTKISEEMIRHATKGYVSESYKNFIEVLLDNNKKDISETVNQVMKIGSSSGTDFLFGVYCMAMIGSVKLRRLKYDQI